jgi:hypothetical protein
MKMSKLQEYLYDQYDLVLLGSEVDDILALARQEIELPSNDEVIEQAYVSFPYDQEGIPDSHSYSFCQGAEWALNKVRNPYPKPM